MTRFHGIYCSLAARRYSVLYCTTLPDDGSFRYTDDLAGSTIDFGASLLDSVVSRSSKHTNLEYTVYWVGATE